MQKKALLAIEAVLYIACRGGADTVSLKDVCKAVNVTERYLEQSMQKLVRSGILKGLRGPKGGYLLARERRKISLADIAEQIDNDEPENSSILGKKVIKPFAEEFAKHQQEGLRKITIEDLYEKVKKEGIDKVLKQNSDFNI